MRILMLGNSFYIYQQYATDACLPDRGGGGPPHPGGTRLSEQLNPNTRLGSQTQAVLQKEKWDYVILQ